MLAKWNLIKSWILNSTMIWSCWDAANVDLIIVSIDSMRGYIKRREWQRWGVHCNISHVCLIFNSSMKRTATHFGATLETLKSISWGTVRELQHRSLIRLELPSKLSQAEKNVYNLINADRNLDNLRWCMRFLLALIASKLRKTAAVQLTLLCHSSSPDEPDESEIHHCTV